MKYFKSQVHRTPFKWLLGAVFCLLATFQSVSWAQSPFKVMFDPGHSYLKPGGVSCRGDNETQYNDQVVKWILRANWSPFEIDVTREPGQNFNPEELKRSGLDELRFRPHLANESGANLFISIHHDSVQKVYLTKNPTKGFDLNSHFFSRHRSGFSIFVSTVNPKYQDSLRFAQLVARRLIGLGRVPSTHHHEDIPNEGYQQIVPELGIYNSKLLVLRETKMPAILIELGLLGDCQDLATITTPEFQRRWIEALKGAIQEFVATSK